MQEPDTCNGSEGYGWKGVEGRKEGKEGKSLSPTKRSGMGRTLLGGREGLCLPKAWGAQAVAGSSTVSVNPGQGRSAEQIR